MSNEETEANDREEIRRYGQRRLEGWNEKVQRSRSRDVGCSDGDSVGNGHEGETVSNSALSRE